MRKVTIEATPSVVAVTVELDGQTWKQTWVTTRHGAQAKGHNFEDVDDIPDELYEALSDLPVLDLMRGLETDQEEDETDESEED